LLVGYLIAVFDGVCDGVDGGLNAGSIDGMDGNLEVLTVCFLDNRRQFSN